MVLCLQSKFSYFLFILYSQSNLIPLFKVTTNIKYVILHSKWQTYTTCDSHKIFRGLLQLMEKLLCSVTVEGNYINSSAWPEKLQMCKIEMFSYFLYHLYHDWEKEWRRKGIIPVSRAFGTKARYTCFWKIW